jgi:hypothetical protein
MLGVTRSVDYFKPNQQCTFSFAASGTDAQRRLGVARSPKYFGESWDLARADDGSNGPVRMPQYLSDWGVVFFGISANLEFPFHPAGETWGHTR